jgi:DNA-binding IclR family transcriptional regulator
VRKGTPPIESLERALRVLDAVVGDHAERNLTALAAEAGIPVASLHRIVGSLERSGYLSVVGRGRYGVGPSLRALAEQARSPRALSALARPDLEALARRTRRIAHLGVFENDMVTYLVKVGRGGERLFTREGMQLEAYCSGVGKVLLAHLDEDERERYLTAAPFVALTPSTRTDPTALREELARVRLEGFALDDREIAADLTCFAVPVAWPDGRARAAISASRLGPDGAPEDHAVLAALHETAKAIERLMFGPRAEASPP